MSVVRCPTTQATQTSHCLIEWLTNTSMNERTWGDLRDLFKRILADDVAMKIENLFVSAM